MLTKLGSIGLNPMKIQCLMAAEACLVSWNKRIVPRGVSGTSVYFVLRAIGTKAIRLPLGDDCSIHSCLVSRLGCITSLADFLVAAVVRSDWLDMIG